MIEQLPKNTLIQNNKHKPLDTENQKGKKLSFLIYAIKFNYIYTKRKNNNEENINHISYILILLYKWHEQLCIQIYTLCTIFYKAAIKEYL